MSLKKSDTVGKTFGLSKILDTANIPQGDQIVFLRPPPLGQGLPQMSLTLLRIFRVMGEVTGSAAVGMARLHSDLDIVIRESRFDEIVSASPDFCEGELGGSVPSSEGDGFSSMKWQVQDGYKVTLLNLIICHTELAFYQWTAATKVSRVVPAGMVNSRPKRVVLYQEVFDMISKRWPGGDKADIF